MQWYNEPYKWHENGNLLTFAVEPNTDYWQITHYGFKRDNGPFWYQDVLGDFEACVKVIGSYKELYHQAGIMIRFDEKNWIKTGIEFVDDVQNISAVVTREFSDWSVVPNNDNPPFVWLKLMRKDDYVEISYSFDEIKYQMLRLAYFSPKEKVQIGVFAAAPGKESFSVTFEGFKIHSL